MVQWSRFFGIVIVVLGQLPALGQVPIEPPGGPDPGRSFYVTPKEADQDLNRLRQRRFNRERGESRQQYQKTSSPIAKLNREAAADRPGKYLAGAYLYYPYVMTDGEFLENYTVDISSSFAFFWRPSSQPLKDKWTFWTGFRAANFSGTASYRNLPGRYGFTYYGPIVALGKFDLALAGVDPNSRRIGDYNFSRTGWLLATGVALQARQGGIERGIEPPDKELDSEGLDYDPPGVWLEVQYLTIQYNAICIHYMFGVQSGNSKLFTYAGIGFGGLY